MSNLNDILYLEMKEAFSFIKTSLDDIKSKLSFKILTHFTFFRNFSFYSRKKLLLIPLDIDNNSLKRNH